MTINTRMTRQKKVIYQVLKDYDGHMFAEEVWKQARNKFSRIGVATVYRNLEDMAAKGLIDSIYVAGQPKWFEAKKFGYHGHTYCVDCKELKDLASCSLCLAKNQVRENADFAGKEFKFLIVGKCRRCLGEDKLRQIVSC